MRFAIDIGHNLPTDGGAVGYRTENELVMEVGKRLIELLENAGHEVVECLPKSASALWHSLKQRVTTANQSRADFFVSIHFNSVAFRAHGTEVWIYNGQSKAKRLAASVVNQIAKLGFYNRGLKHGSFYVLKHTKMPAMLVECAFVSSRRDMDLYEPEAMALAIFQGLCGEGSEIKTKTPAKTARTIKVDAATWLKGSVAQSSQLTEVKEGSNLGEDKKFLLQPGLYTAVNLEAEEEGHYLIELKSGVQGFVYAGHVDIN